MGVEIRSAPFPEPRYWRNSNFHRNLVGFACQMLQEEYGFAENEIYHEYYVKMPIISKIGPYDKYYVDVAAIRDGKRCIAVECGGTADVKLRDLKAIFQKVIYIPGGKNG